MRNTDLPKAEPWIHDGRRSFTHNLVHCPHGEGKFTSKMVSNTFHHESNSPVIQHEVLFPRDSTSIGVRIY